jgi:hypothetical protein
MIRPDKYVSVESSLLGLGARLLVILKQPRSQSELWEALRGEVSDESYYRFVAALDLLYAAGAISISKSHLLERAQ